MVSNSSIGSGEFLPLLLYLNHCITFEALLVDAGISDPSFTESSRISVAGTGAGDFFSETFTGVIGRMLSSDLIESPVAFRLLDLCFILLLKGSTMRVKVFLLDFFSLPLSELIELAKELQ